MGDAASLTPGERQKVLDGLVPIPPDVHESVLGGVDVQEQLLEDAPAPQPPVEDTPADTVPQDEPKLPPVKESVLGGVAWTSLSFAAQQLLQTALSILLARLLLPEDFGIVALASLTISVLGLLRGVGAGTAIVQAKKPTEKMLSSVFWFNAAVGVASTLILLAIAYPISIGLREPRVLPILLMLSPTFFLSILTTVQGSLLARQRRYKLYAKREVAATLLSGAVAVAMAFLGFGYYALVGQSITKGVFSILFLWWTVDWRPKLLFDWPSMKEVMRFGLPLQGSNLLFYLSRNLDNLIVGRWLGATALGIYGFAYASIQQPIRIVQSILGRVMFPELSRIQDDLPRVREVYKEAIRHIAGILWWPLGGLLVMAPEAVPFVYGHQWRPAVFLLQVFVLVAIPQTVATTVGWIFNSQGETKRQFYLGLIGSLALYAGFIIGLRWGLMGIAMSYLVVNMAGAWPFNAYAFATIQLGFGDVMRTLRWPALALAELVAGLSIVRVALLQVTDNPWIVLPASAAAGTVLYVVTLWAADPWLVRSVVRMPREITRASRSRHLA